jgi:hypothetical protein
MEIFLLGGVVVVFSYFDMSLGLMLDRLTDNISKPLLISHWSILNELLPGNGSSMRA